MPPDPLAEVAADVWRVTTPLPFRPRSVHSYLVRLQAGGWLLVDGGADTDAAWAVLDGAVRRVAAGWSAVAAHLITHMHLDHVGLARRVRNASGAPLLMGRLDAERAAHAAAHPDEEADYRERLLREHGAPDALVESVQRGRAAAAPLSSHVPVDHPLPEEEAPLPVAGEWRSVWTPGHTAGHVGVLRPGDGTLIGGDAVLPRITPTIGVNRQRADPVGDYLGALDRLERLAPARVLPGHGDPIEAPASRLADLRQATRDETERVFELLSPSAGPRSAWEVAAARYRGRELPASMQMQALRETLAHLDHLAGMDRVGRASDGGVVRFWPQ